LKAGLSFLKRKVEGQREGQISFLKVHQIKSNPNQFVIVVHTNSLLIQVHAGSVIEQMDTLLVLKGMVERNKADYQPDLTANLENSILSKLQLLSEDYLLELIDIGV